MNAQNPDFENCVRTALTAMPHFKWLGLQVAHLVPGEADLVMPLQNDITFDGKCVQAGPVATLLDFAGGAAALTLVPPDGMLSTADFTVKLLAPARGSQFLARGRVISKTRTMLVSRADAFAYDEQHQPTVLIATGLISMHSLGR